jgi:hypothetical protein
MTEESPRNRIRLELTRRQKEQIRKATGRTVNSLDLGLQGLPDLAEPARHGEERTHRSSPATRTEERNATGG